MKYFNCRGSRFPKHPNKNASGPHFRNRVAGIAMGIILMAAPAHAGIHRLNSDEMDLFHRISTHPGQQREKPTLDPILCIVARQRGADMARRNYYAHTNPSGLGPNFLVSRAGFMLPGYYDSSRSGNNIESIAMSIGNPKEVFSLWLKSSPHRLHVLGGHEFYQQQGAIGVGVFRSPHAPFYKYYVFLSAPPNASLHVRSAILTSPKGAILANTRPFTDPVAAFTGMGFQ